MTIIFSTNILTSDVLSAHMPCNFRKIHMGEYFCRMYARTPYDYHNFETINPLTLCSIPDLLEHEATFQ